MKFKNESADVLMVSSEFTKTDNSITATPHEINYDNMYKFNDFNVNNNEDNNSMSLNATSSGQLEEIKASFFAHKDTRDLNGDSSMINQTIDQLNNQSSIDRINQLVMQSVERVKRTALNYNTDELLNSLNCMKHIGNIFMHIIDLIEKCPILLMFSLV